MISFKRLEEIAYSLTDSVHDRTVRCRHFSFIFQKNRLLSIGYNQAKTTPFNLQFGYHQLSGTHSEISALKRLRQNNLHMKDCSIAVLRIDRNNRLNMSKPCKFCANVLKHFDIGDIYYTDFNGNWTKQ